MRSEETNNSRLFHDVQPEESTIFDVDTAVSTSNTPTAKMPTAEQNTISWLYQASQIDQAAPEPAARFAMWASIFAATTNLFKLLKTVKPQKSSDWNVEADADAKPETEQKGIAWLYQVTQLDQPDSEHKGRFTVRKALTAAAASITRTTELRGVFVPVRLLTMVMCVLMVGGGLRYYLRSPRKHRLMPAERPSTAARANKSAKLAVYVVGGVRRPGVYFLTSHPRVVDALLAAGGPTRDANLLTVNLAAALEDSERINIPTFDSQEDNQDEATPDSLLTDSRRPALSADSNSSGDNRVAIYVVGAVRYPGVYYFDAGARNIIALRAAGGPSPEANTAAINLAAYIEDGAELYVPTRQEAPNARADKINGPEDNPGAAARSPHAAPPHIVVQRVMWSRHTGGVAVDVEGAVRKPGVYRLRPGARCEDALKAAHGPTLDANTDAVNLAAYARDSTQLYVPTYQQNPGGPPITDDALAPISADPPPTPAGVVKLAVHVAGAVRRPGVYHLKPGARDIDALKAAGGPTTGANLCLVNLSQYVEDGMQLYIPRKGHAARYEQAAQVY